MQAGKLRHRVTIQSPIVTKNTRGVDTITGWNDVATVFAEVRSVAGREQAANEQITPLATHQVIIRYRSGLTTKHRLKWGARYFGVASVLEPDNRMRLLTLQCNEIVGTDRAI